MVKIKKECVILLHGIGLNKWSLFLLKRALNKGGYNAIAISYPSTKMNLSGIAKWLRLHHLNADFWDSNTKVHFVTHSMGGLVLKRYMSEFRDVIPFDKIGRAVMLAPPNQGSEIANIMTKFPPYRWLYGPAGAELSTSHQATHQDNIYYDVGVIAGKSRWLYPLSAMLIPGPSDGRVAVERTKLDEAKDHITIRASHTFMVYRHDIQNYIIFFLKNGVFQNGK